MEIGELKKELGKLTRQINLLTNEMDNKEIIISDMRMNLDSVSKDIASKSWSKDKWLDDTILNDYFKAMSDCALDNDVLFLGRSATLIVRFNTQNTVLESLKTTHFDESKHIFLCLSDSTDGSYDSGSHWSLLFLIRDNLTSYHFDSMNSRNKIPARIIVHQAWCRT